MSANPPKPVGARFAGMHPMVAAAFVFLATLAAATLGSVMGHLHPLDTTTMRPALAVGALLAVIFGFLTYRMVRRHQRVVARADRISAVARDHHTVRRLAESTGDVLWEIDANHVIRYVSPQATAVFGWTPEELTGRTPFDFMRQEDAMRAREVAARARAKGGRLVGHVRRVIRPDGSPVYVESVGVPFFDSAGNLAGYRGMDRDITSRRALEERERTAQRLDALGTLAGGLAHDFNNILTVILGHAQLALRDDAAPGDVRDSLNEIRVAGQRGQRIVDEIASFAQAGGSPVRQTTDLAAAVRAALGELEIPPGVRTELDLPESRYCVAATRLQISRIVHNLATNALLAMDGAGTLGVRIDRAAANAIGRAQVLRGQEGPAVFLEISDSGVGIDPRVATRIFDPFFTTRPVGEGVGLGLAAVYGIVSGARGGIDLESRPGGGSTFRIYLPECR
ncbi:MAG: PAS domain S-box protein, partial [Gemmatimonadetes bacterium]|nr:PAS domain S-box protein [Gemmatimonadota bacterium]